MKNKKQFIVKGIFLLMLGLLGFALQVIISPTASAVGLGETSPYGPNSVPGGSHVYYIRKAENGESRSAVMRAYYEINHANNNSTWNNAYIQIQPGANPGNSNVCRTVVGSLNTNQREKYLEVTLEATHGGTKTYYIPIGNACTEQAHNNREGVNGNNVFYGRYKLPSRPSTPAPIGTNFYEVKITVKYNHFNNMGDGNAQRFKVEGVGGGPVKIGQNGEPGLRLPMLGDWTVAKEVTGGGDNSQDTKISIPFGLPCDVNVQSRSSTITVYDADNGPRGFANSLLRFRVREVGGGLVPAVFPSHLYNQTRIIEGGTTAEPVANTETLEETIANLVVMLERGKQYRLEIVNWHPSNAIDVALPELSIYGDTDTCQKNWTIGGYSSVNGQNGTIDVAPGDPVTFHHVLINHGRDPPDVDISGGAVWGGSMSGVTAWLPTGFRPQQYSSSADNVYWLVSNQYIVRSPAQQGGYDFTIPTNAANGAMYCQFLAFSSATGPNTPDGFSNPPACARVRVPPPPNAPVRTVNLNATVDSSPDVETQTRGTFTGRVAVSGFPQPEHGGWGYNEVAKRADPQPVAAQVSTYPSSTSVSPNRAFPVFTGCAGTPTREHPDGCYTFNWRCDTITMPASPNIPTCPNYIRHTCQDYIAAENYNLYETCYYEWTCPAPNAYTVRQVNAPDCRVWRCQYAGAPNIYSTTAPPANPNCEQRCNGGTGPRPVRYLNGDMNCYQQPSFQITCTWNTVPATVITQSVTNNGNYCQNPPPTVQKQAGSIGTQICATLTPARPASDAWGTGMQPGYGSLSGGTSTGRTVFGQIYVYRWQATPDTKCANVVGKPYVKSNGGDVRVGGGVGATQAMACSATNMRATIQTLNQGASDFAGSGTQHAAYATGFINGFISGQYNPLSANPSLGSPPTATTFASNAGGSSYGGEFGAAPACIGFVEKLSSDVDRIVGNQPRNPRAISTLAAGEKKIIHVVGDVFLNQNIVYGAGWSTTTDIPLYQLVVEGNIYISPNVVQLDGLYAAVKTSSGTGGNIFTCAMGIGSVPTTSFAGCGNQLVVNGAFAAQKVHFLRDCGSLLLSPTDGQTTYTGGTDAQACSAGNHAAEVFNYTPEQWIRGSVGPGSNKYDAISSMPPVL